MDGATILKYNEAHMFNLRIHLCLLSTDTTTRGGFATYDTISLRTMNSNDSDQTLAPANVAYEDDFNKLTQTHLLPVPETPTTVEDLRPAKRNDDGDVPDRELSRILPVNRTYEC